jgi:hypothetical protein
MKRLFIIILVLAIIVVAGYSYHRFKTQQNFIARRARRVVCQSTLNGLGKTIIIYANDFDDKYPTPEKWCDLLMKHGNLVEGSFRSRCVPEGPCNYAINKNLQEMDYRYTPSDIVVLFETKPGWNQSGGPEILTTDNHNGKGCNVLYANKDTLLVKFVKTEDLDDLKWEIENNEAQKP